MSDLYEYFKIQHSYMLNSIDKIIEINWYELWFKTQDGIEYLYDAEDNVIKMLDTEVSLQDKARIKIAVLFRTLMSKHKLTQSGLGKRMGLSSTTINNYMKASLIPSDYVMFKVSRTLGCGIDDLINWKF